MMTIKNYPFLCKDDLILIEYKDKKTEYSFHLTGISNWGNPWDHTLDEVSFKRANDRWRNPNNHLDRDFFKVDSLEEAVENFKNWLWGKDFKEILQRKRKWILLNLKHLKGKRLTYDYKPYAEVLVEVIDQDIKLPDVDIMPKKENNKEKVSNKLKVKNLF